jgi:hypothetical protein
MGGKNKGGRFPAANGVPGVPAAVRAETGPVYVFVGLLFAYLQLDGFARPMRYTQFDTLKGRRP